MLVVFSVLLRALELLALLPFRILHLLLDRIAFNPRLGPLRYVAGAGILYVCLALLLVYVAAPIRGAIGHYTLGEKLHYDAERWLATAIYDARGSFVKTFHADLFREAGIDFAPVEEFYSVSHAGVLRGMHFQTPPHDHATSSAIGA